MWYEEKNIFYPDREPVSYRGILFPQNRQGNSIGISLPNGGEYRLNEETLEAIRRGGSY
ncbi:MAG: hypothetical protein LUG96_07050 [Tannerellaceae bacterium]|nr:hypothetical protein [Tannerellaceae bacterium]